MNRKQLIQKYLKFFESKGHKIIPNASLIPENDPTVLFTTAGMHPLTPYLLGQKHPLGKRLVNVQKCIRTGDINEVGDDMHLTFFEMLGNWSLGDYWKKQTIEYSLEFLTKVLKIKKEKMCITCFSGDKDAPRDTESAEIWKSHGIKKIKFLGKKDNWWGPAGKTGPCGPDTEMFYWVGKDKPKPLTTGDNACDWMEIWNDVFMQYNKTEKGRYEPLKQKNVDTGMGVERTIAVLQGKDNIYETELFLPIIKQIEKISKKEYKENEKAMRIIADHIKASIFIITDGVSPSNTEQGYVLRRLIRRAVRYGRILGVKNFTTRIVESVFDIYDDYEELKNKKNILKIMKEEETKFNKTLDKGLRIFNKITKNKKTLSGKDAFLLYQSYGFPIEMIEEMAKENRVKIDKMSFDKESRKHQKLSRTASRGVFGSGLADQSEKTIKLHTATHLLNEALRKVLDKNIKQRGSNITPERLRFDFNFPRKLTEKEIKKVEELVNKKISQGLKVTSEEMPLKKALEIGAQSEFDARYPDIVSIYSIGNFSKEICTGPHVKNTNEIGKFKIKKEESSASGIRRIKAVVK
jgi:alanyl-tRNA synthetase